MRENQFTGAPVQFLVCTISINFISSYDARHGTWNLGARWSDDHQFGTRAYFQLSSSPAELRVENIKENEAGLYRCRVDFKSAPTRNSLVNLTVLGRNI